MRSSFGWQTWLEARPGDPDHTLQKSHSRVFRRELDLPGTRSPSWFFQILNERAGGCRRFGVGLHHLHQAVLRIKAARLDRQAARPPGLVAVGSIAIAVAGVATGRVEVVRVVAERGGRRGTQGPRGQAAEAVEGVG